MAQLGAIAQQDFSQGENSSTSPYALRPGQMQQAVNLILDEQGAIRTRDGTLILSVSAPRPDRKIVKLYDFVDTGLTVRHLAIQKGTAGNNSLFLWNTTPWTLIGDFSSVYSTPDILVALNMALIAAGNQETIKYYDPTNATPFGSCTGAPNAAHLAFHLGYIWAGNTNPSTTSTAGTSSLQSSDLNNPNSWPGANQTFVGKDDGQTITGLAQYTIAESGISPTATLIIWKDFSGYEATGVLGATGFAVQKIKSDMGCVASRSIQFVSGFGIIRLTHRGFALYDGVNDTLISEEERPRIFGRDQYVGLDWTNINLCMATQVPNPPLYICACPISGGNGTLQRVFIYDLVRRSWTVATFNQDIATLQLSLVPNQLPIVYMGDANKGYVRRSFAGDTTDDGTAINWAILTRAFTGQNPLTRSEWIRLQCAFFNITAGSQVSASFFFTPTGPTGSKTVTKTIASVTAIAAYTGWGSDPWGTTPWGSQNAPTMTDQIVSFGILKKCTAVTVQLSGTGPMKLRALTLQARALPETRTAMVGQG